MRKSIKASCIKGGYLSADLARFRFAMLERGDRCRSFIRVHLNVVHQGHMPLVHWVLEKSDVDENCNIIV